MKYTKQYLDSLQFNSPEHHSVIQDLLSKATKQEKLTFAESEYVFKLTQLLQGETPNDILDHKRFNCCRKPFFKHLYLIYAGNLNGALCTILDATGKTLRKEIWATDAESFTFNIAGLPNGMYFLTVNMPDGSLLSKPFQIQH